MIAIHGPHHGVNIHMIIVVIVIVRIVTVNFLAVVVVVVVGWSGNLMGLRFGG